VDLVGAQLACDPQEAAVEAGHVADDELGEQAGEQIVAHVGLLGELAERVLAPNLQCSGFLLVRLLRSRSAAITITTVAAPAIPNAVTAVLAACPSASASRPTVVAHEERLPMSSTSRRRRLNGPAATAAATCYQAGGGCG
jgi:hypothetical protein